ncbi:carboxypeptidase regulatory-like domain-containing protein [Candidatus Kaiserbacteria bacterium]|nr:carboxypeptidase regulatory-like domain-containing protein [Candidatus Kaiserbacteria bacterium]
MTLIDAVIGSALVLVAFVGIAAVFQISIDVVTNNRARAGAIALANEWMEYVRSLEYDDVGTSGGIPSGPLPQEDTVSLNGINYTRRTTIQYVDDPQDGTGASDTYPSGAPVFVDYKAVRVAISWLSQGGERTVYFVTRVEPQNGIEVACTSACGTLSISVYNALSQPVPNAKVRVVNTSTSPQIDLTTYTNVDGMVILAGAPVASLYQITVTKTGYNYAQTYSVTGGNPSPTPPHQQVFQNQTTALTFAPPQSGLDLLAAKSVYTFDAIATSTSNETFSTESQISSSTNIAIVGAVARLSGSEGSYPPYGELESTVIGPAYLADWERFDWSGSSPATTTVEFRFFDASGSIIPDAALSGNAAGFSASSIDLSNLSTSTYPSMRVHARLLTNDASTTPSIDSYTIAYDYGPTPRASTPFRFVGLDKVIGSGPVYKHDFSLQTDASGAFATTTLEWDRYEVSFPSLQLQYVVAIACDPQPEYLAPGTTQISRFYIAPRSTNSLIAEVRAGGALIHGAETALSRVSYAATTTATCGQAYFNYLTPGTYRLTVSAPGYQSYVNDAISVMGTSTVQVTLTQ